MRGIKGKTKNMLAFVMALVVLAVTIFASVAETSHAALKAGVKGKSVYRYLGEGSDGKYYYFDDEERLCKYTVKYDGTSYYGYCMNHDKGFHTDYSYSSKTYTSSSAWKALSSSKQRLLALIMVYGYNKGKSAPYGNTNDYFAATQVLVWEAVEGEIGLSSSGSWSDYGGTYFDMIRGRSKAVDNYYWMRKKIAAHVKGASFTARSSSAATTYLLKYNYDTGKYSRTLTDNNKSNTYIKSGVTSGLSINRSSYNYTFSTSKAGTYSAVLANNISTGTSDPLLVWQPSDSGEQSIILGATDTTRFYVKFKTEEKGVAKIKKTSDDGKVSGFKFNIKCAANGYDKDWTTGSSGTITLNLYPGTYTVTEKLTTAQKKAGYVAPAAKKITVTSGKTSSVTLHNDREKGVGKIKKTSEDGKVSGFTFNVKCAANNYDKTFTTSSTGIITLNLYPGTYTVTEKLTVAQKNAGYVAPAAKTIVVEADKTKTVTMYNKRPKGTAKIIKTSDDGKISGFTFNVKSSDGTYNQNHKTGTSGTIALSLYPGTYTVTEKLTTAQKNAGYVAPAAKTITVKSGETKSVTMHNKRPKGTAKIIKTSDTGVVAGFTFNIKSSDGAYNKTFTTDINGLITASLYPGTYTVTEKLTAAQKNTGYINARPVTVTIKSNQMKEIFIHNEYNPPTEGVRIIKETNDDGSVEGFKFKITGVHNNSKIITSDDILRLSDPVVNNMEDYNVGVWKFDAESENVIDEINEDAKAGRLGEYEIDCVTEAKLKESYVQPDGEAAKPESVELKISVKVSLENVKKIVSTGKEKTDKTGNVTYKDVLWAGAATNYVGEGITNSEGYLEKNELETGIYTVTEVLTEQQELRYYEPQSQTISLLTEGQTGTVLFENIAKQTPVKIKKTCVDNNIADIEFTITGKTAWGENITPIVKSTDENGEIDCTLYGGTYVIEETGLDNSIYIEQEPKTIIITGTEEETVEVIFENVPYIDLSVSKKDLTTNEELPGAVLQILDSQTEEVIEEWTSYSEPYEIKGLIHGKEYILHEKEAPDGYSVAEDIIFTAGEQEEIEMIDAPVPPPVETVQIIEPEPEPELEPEQEIEPKPEPELKPQDEIKPEINTRARDAENGTQVSDADESVGVIDTVEYANVEKGVNYLLRATLMKKDGTAVMDRAGNPVKTDLIFTPKESEGIIDVELPSFDGTELAGEEVVIFENLYLQENDELLVEHADINNERQTVLLKKKEKAEVSVQNPKVPMKAEITPVKENVKTTKTGDGITMYMWAMLMMTSGAAAICCLALREDAARRKLDLKQYRRH